MNPLKPSVFKTDRRVKLGIWGLGRGRHFYDICKSLNIDIVAGCDFFEPLRANFLKENPGAFVTDNAAEFLARDFDAVLLATFCPAHADDAIACLNAGKHVLSEVTAFHTMAEGVRLVEAVEKSDRIYNLAENCPFSAANTWLKRRWDEGLFGELQYAEFEYLHECVPLSYSYFGGKPLPPGNEAHNWRSWINLHYYNTHSLGPIMHITGLRPTRVVALPSGTVNLIGDPIPNSLGAIAPSLISMSNGAVIRNLMGGTTNDGHTQRLWGTRGSAQENVHGGLELRLGGRGSSPLLKVNPTWDECGDLAASAGHGGGDFWVIYYFARQILTGEPAPFDIYTGANCTAAGILAYRSACENGKPFDVPDFHNRAEREAYREDHFAQPRYNTKTGLFGAHTDDPQTRSFSTIMASLIPDTAVVQAAREWSRVRNSVDNPMKLLETIEAGLATWPRLRESRRAARALATRFPDTDAARILTEFLDALEPRVDKPDFARVLQSSRRDAVNRIRRLAKAGDSAALGWLCVKPRGSWKIAPLMPKPRTRSQAPCLRLAQKLKWKNAGPCPHVFPNGERGWKVIAHDFFNQEDGLAYMGNRFEVTQAGDWSLLLGHDGGITVFVDGKAVFSEPRRKNPVTPDRSAVTVTLSKGVHEVMIALDTDRGMGWGIMLRFLPVRERIRA